MSVKVVRVCSCLDSFYLGKPCCDHFLFLFILSAVDHQTAKLYKIITITVVESSREYRKWIGEVLPIKTSPNTTPFELLLISRY